MDASKSIKKETVLPYGLNEKQDDLIIDTKINLDYVKYVGIGLIFFYVISR